MLIKYQECLNGTKNFKINIIFHRISDIMSSKNMYFWDDLSQVCWIMELSLHILYAGGTSLVASYLLLPLLVNILRRKNLLDQGGRRKIHQGFIPSMGGIVIYMAFILAMLVWIPREIIQESRFIIAATSLMFFAGIRDDIVPLVPLHKLAVQTVSACMIVFLDTRISSLYGLFGIYELPLWISYILTVVFIIFVTNAFNLLDGLDGLSGSIACLSMGFMCFWLYLIGDISHAMQLACMVGAILGFLYYNWQPASIFMGDTGSLVIGFLLSYSTVYFISCNGALPVDSVYKFPAVLSAGVAVVLFPVFDTLRVFVMRLRRGRSPFKPDKQHTHHFVLRIKQTHAATVRLMIGAYILIAGSILLLSKVLPDWILLLITLAICIGIDSALGRWVKKTYEHRRETNV